MSKNEWRAALIFYLKALLYILLFPAFTIMAVIGKTDYTGYVYWIDKITPPIK